MSEPPSLARSTLVNVVGLAIPTFASIVLVPVYLSQLGEERYGVLLLALTLLNYFGAFDLGLGRAVGHRIASQVDPRARNRSFWTGLIVSAMGGTAGAALLVVLSHWLFPYIFDLNEKLLGETESAIPWLAAMVPLTSMSSVLLGALQARQAFIALNVSQAIGITAVLGLPLVAAGLGHVEMSALLAMAFAGRLLGTAVAFAATFRILPFIGRVKVHRDEIGTLLSFGRWISGSSIMVPLISIVDRIVIGIRHGTTAVTAYTIPFNLTQRFYYLPLGLNTVLFPRFSNSAHPTSVELLKQAISGLVSLQTPMVVIGIACVHPFFEVWIGQELATRAAPVAIVLLIGIWINGPCYVAFDYLVAKGRPDILAKLQIVELVPFLGLLWILVGWLGIVGGAVACLARIMADASCGLIATSTARVYLRSMAPTVPFIIGATAVALSPLTIAPRIVCSVLITAGSVVVSWHIMPPPWREKILSVLR